MATDVLKWAEWVWDKCVNQWGMTPPKGSNTILINIYLHHKGNEGSGIDVFNDDWGQGVGTDKYGMPWVGLPMPLGTVTIQPYPYQSAVHEIFHIMQYYATNVDRTFPYNDIGRWYVEGTADYFQSYNCESLKTSNSSSYLSNTPAFLFNPQLSLWYKAFQNDTISWSRGVHAYGSQIFFNYLTWKNYITEDFVGKSFASKTKLTPVEYLYQTIPDFTNVYRDFAMKASVLDFPYHKAAINYWVQNWGSTAAYSLSKINLGDVNTYAFSLVDMSTNGFVRPKEKNEAWSYTATKIEATKKANYRIQFIADSLGNSKTISNYYLGLVYQSAKKSNYQNVTSYKDVIDRPMYIGANTYSSINLLNGKCDTTISLPDSTIAYLVAVSTPKSFTGSEIFDYQINVQKSQVTDIINLGADEFIKLSPNPFKNQLNFDFVIKGYQKLNMDVYDISSGAKVASKQNLTPGMPIYLGQLSAGTYVIKVTSSDLKISYQFKMVKL